MDMTKNAPLCYSADQAQRKFYKRQEILAEFESAQITYQQMADRLGLSRQRAYQIVRQARLERYAAQMIAERDMAMASTE